MFPPSAPMQGDQAGCPTTQVAQEALGTARSGFKKEFFEPSGWFKGWRALIARLDLMTAAEPTVPRKFRVAFTDRRAARESLRRILAWPTEKVIIAHGPPITDDGQAFLRRAFRWLAD